MNAPVVLYTRKHCGLCDDAAVELGAISGELGFEFVERDIDANPALREQYDAVIPVVMVDGRVVAKAPFVPEELREIVTEALRRST